MTLVRGKPIWGFWRRNRLVETVNIMTIKTPEEFTDGDPGTVTAGTHKGKSGTVHDIHKSKTGHITVTIRQENGVRFKTLGKNVAVELKKTE